MEQQEQQVPQGLHSRYFAGTTEKNTLATAYGIQSLLFWGIINAVIA